MSKEMRRKHTGILFDDWEIGKKYWGMERTITETDLIMMGYLSGDTNDGPLYEDNGKGEMVAYVHGSLTLIISQGLLTSTFVFDGSYVAALGGSYKFAEAVLVGDSIRPVAVPVSKRESKSRPGVGIVNFEITVYNQRDEVVLINEAAMMIAKTYEIAEDNKLVTL